MTPSANNRDQSVKEVRSQLRDVLERAGELREEVLEMLAMLDAIANVEEADEETLVIGFESVVTALDHADTYLRQGREMDSKRALGLAGARLASLYERIESK